MKISIRYKILLGFVLIFILAICSQTAVYVMTDRYVRDLTEKILSDSVLSSSGAIESFISRIELVHLGVGKEYVDLFDDKQWEFGQVAGFSLKQNGFFNEFLVLSTTGRQYMKIDRYGQVTTAGLDYEIPSREYTTAQSGKTGISKVYFTDQTNIPVFHVFTPIVTDEGTQAGILKSKVRLDTLWDLVSQVKPGENGFTYIVDDEGRLIAHPEINLVLKGTNWSDRPIISNLLSHNVHAFKPIAGLYRNEKGVDVIAYATKIPNLNWITVVEQPINEVFADLNNIRALFVSLAFTALILMVIIALIISGSLTRPIRQLQSATELIMNGTYEGLVTIKSGDEIERLANSFNLMVVKVRDLIMKLTQTISELEVQKSVLNRDATIIKKRDDDIVTINRALEKEKEAVEAERNKFAVVLSGIKDGIIAVDMSRSIIILNKAAEIMTGFTQDEVFGMPISSVLKISSQAGDIPDTCYCRFREDDYEGVTYAAENVALQTIRGKVVFVNIITGQIKENKSVNLGCILTLHDVSEEFELERMKLDFVSMAAHELRTPLTTVRGYLSVLEEKIRDKMDETDRGFIARAMAGANRLNNLIQNLLSVSKIEQGKMQLRLTTFDLSAMLERLTLGFVEMAVSKNVTLRYLKPTLPIPSVTADESRIEEVITNLIANAVAYTMKGEISTSLAVHEDTVEVSIHDTGEGIAESAKPHLFTKFYRVQGPLAVGSKGTGLGLYICKNIIDAHNGKIWVTSTPGEGSTFTFSLPIKNTVCS